MNRTNCVSLILVTCLMVGAFIVPYPVLAQEQGTEAADEAGWMVIRPGDTLFSLARRYEVSVDDLREWNSLTDSVIRVGMRLRVAPPGEEDPPMEDDIEDAGSIESVNVAPLGQGMVAITLGPGETLFSMANRYGLTPDSLAASNPGLPEALEAGMVIVVPQDRVTRERTVRRGDTLFSIARSEGVTVRQLREVNDLSGSAIRVGQRLKIPGSTMPSDRAINLPDAGSFSIHPYPEALSGRTLSEGRALRSEAYQMGHPSLPAGSIVLVMSPDGRHAFAEIVERAPARRPAFIEGSRTLFEALSLNAGDRVTLYRVQ